MNEGTDAQDPRQPWETPRLETVELRLEELLMGY